MDTGAGEHARMIESFKSVSLHASVRNYASLLLFQLLKKWVERESTIAGALNENKMQCDKCSH